MTPEEKAAYFESRKNRNKAIGWSLAGVCVLFFLITLVKLGVF